MGEIVISVRRLQKEIKIFLGCFLLGILINAGAIAAYATQWSELFTQIRLVMVIAAVIYAITILARSGFTIVYSSKNQ